MNGLHLPSEKELRAAYREGEEAVITLFQATVLMLAGHIQKLEDQLAKNSQNSWPLWWKATIQRWSCSMKRHVACVNVQGEKAAGKWDIAGKH